MYIRYINKLCDLHLGCQNYTEAAFTLLLHAELLGWGKQALPRISWDQSTDRYPEQPEWKRKEALYNSIIENFDKGKVGRKVFWHPTCLCVEAIY